MIAQDPKELLWRHHPNALKLLQAQEVGIAAYDVRRTALDGRLQVPIVGGVLCNDMQREIARRRDGLRDDQVKGVNPRPQSRPFGTLGPCRVRMAPSLQRPGRFLRSYSCIMKCRLFRRSME